MNAGKCRDGYGQQDEEDDSGVEQDHLGKNRQRCDKDLPDQPVINLLPHSRLPEPYGYSCGSQDRVCREDNGYRRRRCWYPRQSRSPTLLPEYATVTGRYFYSGLNRPGVQTLSSRSEFFGDR